MRKHIYLIMVLCSALLLQSTATKAQTDIDALMMNKKYFCAGFMYSYSSWDNYWEGSFKRDNANLGTVSTQMIGIMGNYGITNKLNFLFGVPYVKTKASAGTMAGQKGIQDLSLTLKWMPVEKEIGPGVLSLYTLGSVSLPLTNYSADYLPFSIGLQSKTATLRLMADYQIGHAFFTASGAYVARDKVKIDRTAYYTTQMHYTNEVAMPDALSVNLRMGYRNTYLIAEAILDNWVTQGGFDIRKNDMPFLSNQMNATRLGVNVKYTFKKLPGLSLIGGGSYTLSGRNIGQATTINTGAFYLMNWASKKTAPTTKH